MPLGSRKTALKRNKGESFSSTHSGLPRGVGRFHAMETGMEGRSGVKSGLDSLTSSEAISSIPQTCTWALVWAPKSDYLLRTRQFCIWSICQGSWESSQRRSCCAPTGTLWCPVGLGFPIWRKYVQGYFQDMRDWFHKGFRSQGTPYSVNGPTFLMRA